MLTRFAPSPTGCLHLGHLLHMIYVWGVSSLRSGKVLLRFEDHDSQRCRAEYQEGILDDLHWLGIELPYTQQSERREYYQQKLDWLWEQGHVYACRCSRKDLQARGRSGVYDGFCRELGHDLSAAHCVRLRLPHDQVSWRGGRGRADALGDISLLDRRGNFTYHFCVVCDDIAQGIDFIVRGIDLNESTAVQIYLAKLLAPNYVTPNYIHHPLLLGNDGTKLSKRYGAACLKNYRRGRAPEELFQMAAEAGGLDWQSGGEFEDQAEAAVKTWLGRKDKVNV